MNNPCSDKDKLNPQANTGLKQQTINSQLDQSTLQELANLKALILKTQRCSQKLKNTNASGKNNKSKVDQELLEQISSDLYRTEMLLKSNNSNFLIARKIRREAESAINRIDYPIRGSLINLFKYFLHESSTSFKVIMGMFLVLPVYAVIPYLPQERLFVEHLLKTTSSANSNSSIDPKKQLITKYEVDITISLLVLAGTAGSIGSVISVLSRMKEYDEEKYSDDLLPVIVGASKPLIGGSFAILLFTLIFSGLLPLKIDNDKDITIKGFYALFAISFIAGFSERLVKDIIAQTETRVFKHSETQAIQGAIQKNPSNHEGSESETAMVAASKTTTDTEENK